MIRILASFLKKFSLGRALYPYLNIIWRWYSVPARRRKLHSRGYDAIARLHKLFTDNGIKYYFDAGTLLGFIREGGFIKNDDDVDLCIVPETKPLREVLKLLLDNGYAFMFAFEYNGRFLEFTIRDQSGIPMDIFLHEWDPANNGYLKEVFLRWYADRQYPTADANTALEFHYKGPTGLKNISVRGVDVSVPENAEEMLDSEYGSWRSPDPSFKSETMGFVELPGYAYKLTKEAALSHR